MNLELARVGKINRGTSMGSLPKLVCHDFLDQPLLDAFGYMISLGCRILGKKMI